LNISIVIITYNNLTLKNGCLESVILSLYNQINVSYEIIIVDNSSNKKNIKYLQKLQKKYITLHVIYNSVNNISMGRNIGAKNANYELILFMDDDIILPQKNILEKMIVNATNKEYGFSAIRLWTPEDWYKKNKRLLNRKIRKKVHNYDIQASEPLPEIRRKNNNRHLIRTYIGNFGFIKKNALIEVGYWDECYKGYGVEDDAMVFKLYLKYHRPVILNNICVIHIWHNIKDHNYKQLNENKKIYDSLLKKHGIDNFHIGRLLYNESNVIEFTNQK